MKLIQSEAIISSTLLLFSVLTTKAQQYGDFGYTVANGIVTITNYTGAGGAVSIPSVIPVNAGLANPIWTPLQTNTLPTDTFYFSDPQWTNYPARLYRVRSPVLSP
jgi:hypothetical protein